MTFKSQLNCTQIDARDGMKLSQTLALFLLEHPVTDLSLYQEECVNIKDVLDTK